MPFAAAMVSPMFGRRKKPQEPVVVLVGDADFAATRDGPYMRKDLTGANYRGADLRRADAATARLGGADLAGADLRGANLALAVLQESDLSGANLAGAGLFKTQCTATNFERANLEGADLWMSRLQRACLREANLSDANLREAKLEGADLRGAILSGADLRGAVMGGSAFVPGSSGYLEQQDLNADLTNARLDDVEWDDSTVWPAEFIPPTTD